MGPGSLEALGLGFCQFQILVIWGPYESPVLVACQGHSKSPKTAGARCDMFLNTINSSLSFRFKVQPRYFLFWLLLIKILARIQQFRIRSETINISKNYLDKELELAS